MFVTLEENADLDNVHMDRLMEAIKSGELLNNWATITIESLQDVIKFLVHQLNNIEYFLKYERDVWIYSDGTLTSFHQTELVRKTQITEGLRKSRILLQEKLHLNQEN